MTQCPFRNLGVLPIPGDINIPECLAGHGTFIAASLKVIDLSCSIGRPPLTEPRDPTKCNDNKKNSSQILHCAEKERQQFNSFEPVPVRHYSGQNANYHRSRFAIIVAHKRTFTRSHPVFQPIRNGSLNFISFKMHFSKQFSISNCSVLTHMYAIGMYFIYFESPIYSLQITNVLCHDPMDIYCNKLHL